MIKKIFIALVLGVAWLLFLWLFVSRAFVGTVKIPADIHIAGLPIHLYGLTMALAILIGWYIAVRIVKMLNLSAVVFDKSILWIVLGGLLGSRIYFVVFHLDFFLQHPLQIPAFWNGGLSIYGSLIGGTAAFFIWARRNEIDWLRYLDAAAVGLLIAQAVGRWGNFFNQEAFGYPTDLPWAMYVEPVFRPLEFLNERFFHPTFLYESLWGLLGFIVFYNLAKKNPQKGILTAGYLMYYSFARFFIEMLRVDSTYVLGFRLDQATSVIMFTVGLLIIITKSRESAFYAD